MIRMAEMSIEKLFYKNVKFLCEMKGMGLGKIEDNIRKRRGFLSKTARGVLILTLSDAFDIARFIDEPLEKLITADYEKVERKKILYRKIESLEEELKRLKGEAING